MQHFYSLNARCVVRYHDLPGQGAPLVFVHGLGCASSYEYPRVVMEPAFGGRRAILIDLPGSGYSEKPQTYSYSTTQQARVVVELVEHLALPRCWLYGHSMGGSIAIEAARMLEKKLAGLAVSEPNFHAGGGAFSRLITTQTEAEFIERGYAALLAQDTTPWAGSLQSNAPVAVWRAAKSLVEGVVPSWCVQFQRATVPVLLIWGEKNRAEDEFIVAGNRGMMTALVPDAGHSMSWENPAALAKILGDFCRDGGGKG